jgi:hypothetical protein
VAYQVTHQGQSVIHVNQQKSAVFDGFLRQRKSVYSKDNTFHAIGVRDKKVIRIDVQPET